MLQLYGLKFTDTISKLYVYTKYMLKPNDYELINERPP